MKAQKNIQTWLDSLEVDNAHQRSLLSTSSEVLAKKYKQAVDLNALSIMVPEEMGGAPLGAIAQYHYYKKMVMTSGALTFLCAQHISALAMIASGKNAVLKDKYLTKNQSGEYLLGISFSHLRQFINPPVTATENGNAYTVNGMLTYVTGYQIFNTIVLGFVCNDKELFAVMPLCESSSMNVVKTLNLVTANSTNTVACQLVNHRIDKSQVIMENPLGTFANRAGKLIQFVAFPLGLATSALKLMESHPYLEMPLVLDTYHQLCDVILNVEKVLFQLPEGASIVPLRIKATYLLSKVFLFTEQIVKGRGTLEDHPLFLIKKEAMILTASGSTIETLNETCRLLSPQLKN